MNDRHEVADRRISVMQRTWRPMMAYLYMLICFTDFVLFPVLWIITQAILKLAVITPWQPLTLQSAGLFHLAMGGVLGVTAYGRSQEKLSMPSYAETSTTYSDNSLALDAGNMSSNRNITGPRPSKVPDSPQPEQ